MIDTNILQKAIDKWGEVSQIEMIEEEAIELALALQKYKRTNTDPIKGMENIYDELADMKIMLAQAELLFDPDKNSRVEFKMNRLSKILVNN